MSKAMNKNHWLKTTLIVLVVCALVGSILGGVLFFLENKYTSASASLTLSFEGAAKGLAPNGNPYDVYDMASDEILNAALEAAGLSGTYTAEQLRSCLMLQGVYPENFKDQVISYESLLNFMANRELTLSDYHPTTYGVTLKNKFDTGISQANLSALLDQILIAYKNSFAKTGAINLERDGSIFTLSDYDYPQQLQIIQARLTNLTRYSQELNNKFPAFRLSGQSFSDITVRLDTLAASDFNRIEAQMTMNALTKDTSRLLIQYQYEIRNLTYRLQHQTEQLAKVDALVASYEKNEVIYLSTTNSLNKIDGNSSATYDKLVARRKAVSDEITEIRAEISDYQLKISDLMGGNEEELQQSAEVLFSVESENAGETALEEAVLSEDLMTEEEIAAVVNQAEEQTKARIAVLEENIEAMLEKLDTIVADFDALIQAKNAEQINELTVTSSSVRVEAPKVLSGAFVKKLIKTAGPFCAVGFMVCMLLIFISRRREIGNNA